MVEQGEEEVVRRRKREGRGGRQQLDGLATLVVSELGDQSVR
jgi:hypothetical protein